MYTLPLGIRLRGNRRDVRGFVNASLRRGHREARRERGRGDVAAARTAAPKAVSLRSHTPPRPDRGGDETLPGSARRGRVGAEHLALVAVLAATLAPQEPNRLPPARASCLAGWPKTFSGRSAVERVCGRHADPDTPARLVEACFGRRSGALRSRHRRVRLGHRPVVALPYRGSLRRTPWAVVSVPIAAGDGIAGTVAVATCRERGLAARDVELLERLSRRASSHSDRRNEPIDWQTRFERGLDRDIAA